MRFEDFRRGHWMFVAVLAGTALAWLQSTVGGNLTQTHSQAIMEQLVMRPPVKGSDGSTYSWVRSLWVYPAVEAQYASSQDGKVPRKSAVTFEILSATGDGKGWTYRPATALVDEPYRAGGNAPTDPNYTAARFLAEISQDRDWIKYHYAWWREPTWLYTICIGAAVLVIGIIWPTVQNKLVYAGYGRQSDVTEKKESLWKRWFGDRSKRSAADDDNWRSKPSTASSTALSQDELDRIAQMEDGLKDFLKTGDREIGGEVDESQAQPTIRQLNAGPADSATMPEKPKEEKDYGGEFYPTVAHGKKKPEGTP